MCVGRVEITGESERVLQPAGALKLHHEKRSGQRQRLGEKEKRSALADERLRGVAGGQRSDGEKE